MLRFRCVSAVTAAACFLVSSSVAAQPLGTFRWRLAPYCNVVTLDAVSQASSIAVSGIDDQCGAPVAAAASGTAHVNPNGTVSLSLVVTRPDGIALSSSVEINLATLSGVWSDDTGNSGTFVFNPPAAPGDPRPITLRGIYAAGFRAAGNTEHILSTIWFGRVLPTAPVVPVANIVPFNGPPTLNCPGSVDDPRALPGQLCLYERLRINVDDFQVLNSAGDLSAADTTGAVIGVRAAGIGAVSATGAWAVTIP